MSFSSSRHPYPTCDLPSGLVYSNKIALPVPCPLVSPQAWVCFHQKLNWKLVWSKRWNTWIPPWVMSYLVGREYKTHGLQQERQMPSSMLAVKAGCRYGSSTERGNGVWWLSLRQRHPFFIEGRWFQSPTSLRGRGCSAASWLSYKPRARWDICQGERAEQPRCCHGADGVTRTVLHILRAYFTPPCRVEGFEPNYWWLFKLVSEASLACPFHSTGPSPQHSHQSWPQHPRPPSGRAPWAGPTFPCYKKSRSLLNWYKLQHQ